MLTPSTVFVLFSALSLAATSSTAETNSTWPVQTYQSANFTPPKLKITHSPAFHHQHHQPGKHEEYIFIAPGGTPSANPFVGPLIMNPSDGELVWNGPHLFSFNFGVQTYKNEPVLVSWNGSRFPEPVGRGNGYVYLWDKHYEEIAKVTLPGNFAELTPGQRFESNIDLHELFITEWNTLLVTGNNVTQTDLSSVGGKKDGWVVEAQAYEIDIATNEVLFSWKSLEHLDAIPLNASLYPLGSEGYDGHNQSLAWGYFYINTMSPNGKDGYILSSRYTCSAIAIDKKTGNVEWILQGRRGGSLNEFELGEGVDFCYQHHVRVAEQQFNHETGKCSHITLQMHDNHNAPLDNDTVPSSGKVIDVDLSSRTATLRTRYLNPSSPIFPTAQGSFQRLPNNNVFEGHGYVPILEEFSPNGTILTTFQFGHAVPRPGGGFLTSEGAVTLSYRSFKQPWIGCPRTKPDVVAKSIGPKEAAHGTEVFISWNGATEVEAWEVHGGIETVSYMQTVEKRGFETRVNLSSVEFVRVKPVLKRGAPKDCGQDVMSDLVFVNA